MKKILGILALLLIEVASYSKIEENIAIEVVGEVLSAVTIKNTKDLDFGNVAEGMTVTTSKTGEAELEITGSIGDRVKLQWKGTDGKYIALTKDIKVDMKKGTESISIPAIISLAGDTVLAEEGNSTEIILNKSSEQIRFKGLIENVPNVPEGEYFGNFVVRILAVNEN